MEVMWPLSAVSVIWSVKKLSQSLLLHYTAKAGTCNIEESIFKPCGAQCNDTCTIRRLDLPVVCLPYCKPGCACPVGQVRKFYVIKM